VSASMPPSGEGTQARRDEDTQNIAKAIADVSERATQLVREEIELAKAEMAQKASRLARGAVVGVAAGVFFMTALVFVLIGCAWLLYYFLPGNDFTYFWGFFAMAAILVLLGVLAGLLAAKAVKRSSPPVPKMAIEEARKIRESVTAPPAGGEPAAAPAASGQHDFSQPAPSPQDAPSPGPAPAGGEDGAAAAEEEG